MDDERPEMPRPLRLDHPAMKGILRASAVAIALAGLVALPATPSMAASEVTVNFCTYTATTPVREYTTSWKVRGSELWWCTAEGEASHSYKRVASKLQAYSRYFDNWYDVTSSPVSGVTKWGTAVTRVARAKCSKDKFRTVAWGIETSATGDTFRTLPQVYSPSKTITSCS
ncbi:MAG: hypothetical protein ACOH1Y_03500 [Propionicimonas sp.]